MTRIAPMQPLGQRKPRTRSKDHLAFIHELPCVVCLVEPVEAAHLRLSDPRWHKRSSGMQEKPRDTFSTPLCSDHHREQRSMGEAAFWERVGIDPFRLCAELALHTGDVVTGRQIVADWNRGRAGT